MSRFIYKITYYREKDLLNISKKPLTFLRQLRGLCIFDIQGNDTSRTRVITTLIHGNEPSGFIALHQWLLEKTKPAVNIRIIVCNVEAAQLPPEFSHRYLHSGQDLNRFFSSDSPNIDIICRAQQINQAVAEMKPEAVIDLHNTSGASPAFGVAIDGSDQALDLISLFTHKVILTGLRVGAIMEQNFNAPIVTIECGGAKQLQSHQLAYQGLFKFVNEINLFDRHDSKVNVYRHPCRVELLPYISVTFGDVHSPTADMTLRADSEQLNNQLTPKDELIGWFTGSDILPLTAKNEQGIEQIDKMFYTKKGCIFTKHSMQIFMATTNTDIVSNDCLFYATLE